MQRGLPTCALAAHMRAIHADMRAVTHWAHAGMPVFLAVAECAGRECALRGRFLVAAPAPLWQRPLVQLSGLFLKSPAQVRTCSSALPSLEATNTGTIAFMSFGYV